MKIVNKVLAISVVLLLMFVSVSPINIAQKDEEHITLSFSDYTIDTIETIDGTFSYVSTPSCVSYQSIGYPDIPVYYAQIFPKEYKNIHEIYVSGSQENTITLGYPLFPVQEQIHSGQTADFAYNEEVYTTDTFIIEQDFEEGNIGYKNGYPIKTIIVFPFNYNPVTNKLTVFEEITITIEYEQGKMEHNKLFRTTDSDKAGVINIVDNDNAVEEYEPEFTYETQGDAYPGGICNASDEYQYVILTNESLESTTGYDYNWSNLMSHRETTNGFNCTIVTVEEINITEDYWNGTARYNDTPAKIREFCKDAYLDWGMQYLLIGGGFDLDHDYSKIVPFRLFTDRLEDDTYDTMPCDMYYNHLDGDWWYDTDSIWGGGRESGVNDYYGEFYLGRLTVYNASQISNIVNKTIWYETNTSPEVMAWKENVSFHGGDLGWTSTSKDKLETVRLGNDPYGDNVGFEEWNSAYPAMALNTSIRNYHEDIGDEAVYKARVKAHINNDNSSILVHNDHGTITETLSLTHYSIRAFSNQYPFFAYSVACSSGRFLDTCGAHMITVEGEWNRSVAGMYQTAYGYDGTGSTSGAGVEHSKYFWDYFFNVSATDLTDWHLGKAMLYQKDKLGPIANTPGKHHGWCHTWYSNHYFGDPALILQTGYETQGDIESTINFAGNLSDSGGPYWQPPHEDEQNLSNHDIEIWRDGYYTTNSKQHEDWMYINCSITNATTVYLDWLNETTWTNGTYELENTNADYWEINTSGNISVMCGYNYSFNINATNGINTTILPWNKTGIGGDEIRRFVQLNCTPVSIEYIPYYFYENEGIVWGDDVGRYDLLSHDQGVDGGEFDSGVLNDDTPTDTVHSRTCASYVAFWHNESICTNNFNLENVYFHIWWSTDSDAFDNLGIDRSRAYPDRYPDVDWKEFKSNNRSTIYYDGPTDYDDYYLTTHKLLTNYDFTDNSIYELFINGEGGLDYPSIISNRSFTSFVLYNVPDNTTLNASHSDSDSDSLTDWEELYVYYTNPFLNDTDNDGVNDYGESRSGSDPNNYTDTLEYTEDGPEDCNSTGYLYGNWSFSEHINATGVLEEEWVETNETDWYVSPNYHSWWAGNYTYEVNLTAMDAGRINAYTVLNNSGLNRTQGAGWLHWNASIESIDPPYPYIIFAYKNASCFDCIMWHQQVDAQAWILHWDGQQFTDVHDGTVITLPETTGTDVAEGQWEQGYFMDGWYYKYIYNEHNGSIRFKFWDATMGFVTEPEDWFVETWHTNITYDDAKCQGIGVFDPEDTGGIVQWDMINVWQLNYTVNNSDWINLSHGVVEYNVSRPHMDFPVLDLATFSEEDLSFYNNTHEGNLSVDYVRSIMKDNFTNLANMESRMFINPTQSSGEQNDTVYYYSCIVDNNTAVYPDEYDEFLRLHIQMCPEDKIRDSEYIDFLIGIDTDNNRQQDKQDRVYWAYANDEYEMVNFSYNGYGDPIENNGTFNIFNTSNSSTLNLHRYSTHINLIANIPLADLKKSNGEQLTSGDTFGLCVITTNADVATFNERPCVWQNWNETSETYFWDEDEGFESATEYFFNYSDEHDGPLGNATSMGRWGEGKIVGTMNEFEGKQSTNLSINKTVWNNDTLEWVTRYNATEGEKVRFNITVVNNGSVSHNLVVRDNHYDAVRQYEDGSTWLTYPDHTRVNHEPNFTSWEDGSCYGMPHGHLYWYISGTNLSAHGFDETGATLWLEFNMTINTVNYSENEAGATFCDGNYDWWDDDFNTSIHENIWLNEKFNVNITCNCTDISEESKWAISEHINRPCVDSECYDEEWFEYETNYTSWESWNDSWHNFGNKDWNWTYHYNGTGDDMNLSYTIANYSCTNRSFSLLRMRYNVTDPYYEEGIDYEPCVGIIYNFQNHSYFDMVLYSYQSLYLISNRDGVLFDSVDGQIIAGQDDATNHYFPKAGGWTTNISKKPSTVRPGYYGVWAKTLWNGMCNKLQTKAWNINDTHPFALEYEPPGWIFDGETSLDQPINTSCFGLVVWSNTSYNFTADFDFIEEWRLNYSRDPNATASQLENHSVYGSDGIPLMKFPVYNKSHYEIDYLDWLYNCYDEYFIGNISSQEYADCTSCFYQNLTNRMSMVSRAFEINDSIEDAGGPETDEDTENQNDTIYYYTAVFTDLLSFDYPYNNSLFFHIEECADGTDDSYDGVLVCIDVDNDMTWDDNDIAIYSQRVWAGSWDTRTIVYNGTTEKYNVWESEEYAGNIGTFFIYDDGPLGWQLEYFSYLPLMHRFGQHRAYELNIPLYHFEKGAVGSGNYLQANDTFGLHVMTVDDDSHYCPVWENWNESACTNYTINDNNASAMWNLYMNCTNWGEAWDFENGIWNGVNESNMQYWGHGRIGNGSGDLTYLRYTINMTKTANISVVSNISINSTINYTITICNDGDSTVENVTVNDSLPPCMDLIDCSLDGADYYENSPGNWSFNVTSDLDPEECTSFNFTVNVSANCLPNGSTLVNWANASTNQSATATANCSVKYGGNLAPIITNHYPLINRTITTITLLLADINVTIEDPNADEMNLYFFTNKTNGYYEDWNPIGQNLSVSNGTYSCNQTFNFSLSMNTRWRWGNTYYYFSANVTDGKVWTNETFPFLTDYSRYNMNAGSGTGLDNDVDVQDALYCWNHRQGESDYYGIYNVAGDDEDVDVQDALTIWNNIT